MPLCSQHQLCINKALELGEKICAENGRRFTKIRREVLGLIWQSHKPAKAYDIMNQLDENIASLKPPTVYRALDFLRENGLVHKINSLNAFVGCSHPAMKHQCYFLICSECGDIAECCAQELTNVIEKTADKNHFKPEQASLEIQGICENCGNMAR